MNHRKRRGSLVMLAALAALVTIAAGVLFQGSLRLTYYEYRLRLAPSFLLRIISAPEASPAQVAASRFLEERRGREVLFQAYITHLAEEIDHEEADPRRIFASFGGGRAWFDASYSGRKLEAGESFCDGHDVVPGVKRLLPRLEGEVFRLPGTDDLEFSILASGEAAELYRRGLPDAEAGSVFTYQGSDPYVCRVRKKGPRGRGKKKRRGGGPCRESPTETKEKS